jgi:hypothetical protein
VRQHVEAAAGKGGREDWRCQSTRQWAASVKVNDTGGASNARMRLSSLAGFAAPQVRSRQHSSQVQGMPCTTTESSLPPPLQNTRAWHTYTPTHTHTLSHTHTEHT